MVKPSIQCPTLGLSKSYKDMVAIGGKLIMWLKSFLNGRFQRVVLNRVQSHWSEVTSGIPQGSVLEPLQFVLYINDVGETI